jgi:4-amino-4-deoxy-L-arabinose transferase-like glycosyltransferase
VLAVSGLALSLRVHALGRESLWLDEGFTWERSSLPLPALVQHAIRGHHNPCYFILLHYWLGLGDDEFMLRFPSALAGGLAAGACVVLGYVLRGLGAGITAGIVLALTPLQIQYGQEARMYSLLSFTATVAMIGVVWLVRHPERAAVPIFGTARLWRSDSDEPSKPACAAWLAYVLGVISTLYMHNTAVVFAASAGLALLAACFARSRLRLRMIANLGAASMIVLAVFGVYLGTEIQQAKTLAGASFWAKFPTARELLIMTRELYLLTAPLLSPLAALLAGAFVLGLWQLRRSPPLALVMLVLCFAGPGLLLLVSLYKPIFGVRMLLWAAVPCCALIGAGVASVRHPVAPVMFSAAVAALVWPALAQQYVRVDKEPWRELVKTVEARARPDAMAVAASAEEAMMIRYYRQRRSHPLGTFRFVAARRKLPREVHNAPQIFLFDRKRGTRSARSLRALEARGYTAKARVFRNLKLIELAR